MSGPVTVAQASSETVAWAIMHVNCDGIWKITEDKDSADYWERSGFPVRALAYSVPSAKHKTPATESEIAELRAQLATALARAEMFAQKVRDFEWRQNHR